MKELECNTNNIDNDWYRRKSLIQMLYLCYEVGTKEDKRNKKFN